MAENDPAADPPEIGLEGVQSLAAFAAACSRLRAGRSYGVLEQAARPLSLPKATLSDLLNAKSTPTRETVVAFLTACGVLDEAQRSWLAAWERVATAHQPRPDSAVRVREARPRMLGVHAAIQIEDAHGELPPYVPRDLDADLRTAITAAAANGGLVLMIGGSSVGKTRALYEAVRATLPEWWLLHPADIPTISAHAATPTPRTVLWLDELQRYLNHPAGLTLSVLHRLITAGTVVVATLWPDEYSRRTARPAAGQPDPYSEDREILHLAHVVRVPDRFTSAERRRGEALANTDRRLQIALDTTDAGFTQVLAAGPALIQRWETAEDCYGQAVITAALDARRVGAQHPLTRGFLNAAAPNYLSPAQQATAPPDWLNQALAYATAPVHGATGCLSPTPAGMGRIGGYAVADYLTQHARRSRSADVLLDEVWQALVEHHHPVDSLRLAASAHRGASVSIAETLWRDAVHRFPNSAFARTGLAATLKACGRLDEAEVVYRETLAQFPDDVLIHAGLAETLRAAGRLDEAEVVYRETLAQFPDNVVTRDGLAETLRAAGRLDEAEAIYRETLAQYPFNVVAHTGLAETLRAAGRLDEAEVAYRETLAKFPDNVVTRDGLAETLRARRSTGRSEGDQRATFDRFPSTS